MLFFAPPIDVEEPDRPGRTRVSQTLSDNELKVVLIDREFGRAFSETLESVLREAGMDGFELVHIDVQKTPERLTYRCILKRSSI